MDLKPKKLSRRDTNRYYTMMKASIQENTKVVSILKRRKNVYVYLKKKWKLKRETDCYEASVTHFQQ